MSHYVKSLKGEEPRVDRTGSPGFKAPFGTSPGHGMTAWHVRSNSGSGEGGGISSAPTIPLKTRSDWPYHLAERPVRVLLVDDDQNMRHVISQELLADQRLLLVAQADSFRSGRRALMAHDFDVLMVDINLGDGTGYELISHMKRIRPSSEAVVISVMDGEESALRAFESGATGYLVKYSWFDRFADAILEVANGGAAITPQLAKRLLLRLEGEPGRTRKADGSFMDQLSEREKEVLKMIAGGYTSTAIGARLLISSQTVNVHVRNIYRKLRVRTRAQAVNYAISFGML